VLNFLVPFPEFWPDRTTVRLELGPGCLTGGIPTADGQLWVGMTIQKGQYKDLRAGGPDALTEELLRRTSPDLAAHLRVNADRLKHPVLLDVISGVLDRWTAPGVLILGDAAHPMPPNGGQGSNMALRDALVAANHLCPVLAKRERPDRNRYRRPPGRGGAQAGDRRYPGAPAETNSDISGFGPRIDYKR
jgi:2-polyprenyl-6-methoxyphenol hydroxylase-like FAD-dependent oxidoreductase